MVGDSQYITLTLLRTKFNTAPPFKEVSDGPEKRQHLHTMRRIETVRIEQCLDPNHGKILVSNRQRFHVLVGDRRLHRAKNA